jgi:prepilin-type processing-associated H-X9-DG protein
MVSGNDQRGILWWDEPSYGHIYAYYNPNTASPDYMLGGWCNNLPEMNLPCVSGDSGPNNTATSRSHHAGGVNVVMGDGSVHFISQAIDNATWRGLVTIAGGEVLGDY